MVRGRRYGIQVGIESKENVEKNIGRLGNGLVRKCLHASMRT